MKDTQVTALGQDSSCRAPHNGLGKLAMAVTAPPRQQQTVQPPLQPELRQEQVKKTSRKITLLEIENKRLYTYCDKNRRQQETNRIDKSSAV